MSFPRYPSYRDSDVDWLGQVPSSWRVQRFRHLFRESSEKVETEVIGPMLSVSGYRGIEIKEYDDENRRRLDDELVGYRIVRVGQLVVNTMWLNYAGLGVSNFEGHVSPAYRSYWISASVNPRFIHYLLRSAIYVQGYTRLLTGIRPNSLQMSREDLMDFPVLVPPEEDQASIADFLDSETAKIDSLIAEQEQLIELLQEKRQAVISQAVTKGLNLNAPMNPSGVGWLGDVPAHWEVTRLKHVGKSIIGLTYSPEDIVDEGAGTLVLRASNVQDGVICFEDTVYVTTRIPLDLVTRAGDILVCARSGSRKLIGKNAVIDERSAGVTFGAFMTVIRSRYNTYLACVLNSSLFEYQAGMFMTSTINQLTAEVLDNLELPFPPESEQTRIAAFISETSSELNELSAETQRAIELLRERRSVLISAAVTGQIDVRALVEQEAA